MSDAAAAKRSATLHIDRREKADTAAVTAAASKTGVPFEISLPALPHSDAVYTPREERANALTHAVGIPLALLFLVFMLLKAEGLLQVISALALASGRPPSFWRPASTTRHATPGSRKRCASSTMRPST